MQFKEYRLPPTLQIQRLKAARLTAVALIPALPAFLPGPDCP
jgi:hypothetical protein